jgi:hypothetical protein
MGIVRVVAVWSRGKHDQHNNQRQYEEYIEATHSWDATAIAESSPALVVFLEIVVMVMMMVSIVGRRWFRTGLFIPLHASTSRIALICWLCRFRLRLSCCRRRKLWLSSFLVSHTLWFDSSVVQHTLLAEQSIPHQRMVTAEWCRMLRCTSLGSMREVRTRIDAVETVSCLSLPSRW